MSANPATDQYGSGLGQFYQGAKAGHQYGTEVLMVIEFIAKVTQALVNLIAYPWLLVMRYEFGERFLNGWIVFLHSLVFGFIAVAAKSLVGEFIAMSLALVWAVHKRRINKRNKLKIRWHSRSNGISRLQQLSPAMSSDRVNLLYEPFILSVLGLFLMVVTYAIYGGAAGIDYFGVVLVIGGLCVHFHHAGNRRRNRNLLLDQIDSQITSQHFAQALQGESDAHQTDGFVVQGAEEWSENERQLVEEAVLGRSV